MAREDVKKESNYHGRGDVTILVILHWSVESYKVSLSEKNPQ